MYVLQVENMQATELKQNEMEGKGKKIIKEWIVLSLVGNWFLIWLRKNWVKPLFSNKKTKTQQNPFIFFSKRDVSSGEQNTPFCSYSVFVFIIIYKKNVHHYT